jgi:hypothetical protein
MSVPGEISKEKAQLEIKANGEVHRLPSLAVFDTADRKNQDSLNLW